jgi:hypothetical protein
LKDRRIERGIAAFVAGASSSEAAEIAGMPRAPFSEMIAAARRAIDRLPA